VTKLKCLVYRLQLLFRTRTNPEDHHDVISSPALSRELSLSLEHVAPDVQPTTCPYTFD
jgi:hypothetical protein